MQNEVAVFYHHVGNPFVEICDLGDLSCFQKFSEMTDLRSDRVVVICELVGPELKLFRLFTNTTQT